MRPSRADVCAPSGYLRHMSAEDREAARLALSVLAAGIATWFMLRHYAPSLFLPYEAPVSGYSKGQRFMGDLYAAAAAAVGALPPLAAWRRSLHRHGHASWDD